MTVDKRRALLVAALGFLRLREAPEYAMLHRWLDCWRGIGDVVIGMERQGYDVSLKRRGPGQRCAICRRPILEGDRVRISADTSDGPLLFRHVRYVREGQDD